MWVSSLLESQSWCSLQGAAETESLEVERWRGIERSENWHRMYSLLPLDVQAESSQRHDSPDELKSSLLLSTFMGYTKSDVVSNCSQGTSFYISAAGTSLTALVIVLVSSSYHTFVVV